MAWRVAHLAEVIGERVIVVDDDDRRSAAAAPATRARRAWPPPSTRPDPSPRRRRAERRARTPPRTPPPSFPPFPRSRMRTSSSSTEACGAGVRPSAAPRAMLEGRAKCPPRGKEIRRADECRFVRPLFENPYGQLVSLFLHQPTRRDPRWRRHTLLASARCRRRARRSFSNPPVASLLCHLVARDSHDDAAPAVAAMRRPYIGDTSESDISDDDDVSDAEDAALRRRVRERAAEPLRDLALRRPRPRRSRGGRRRARGAVRRRVRAQRGSPARRA